MPASTIHVEPNSEGRWIVRHEDEREPLSEHESATGAKYAARALAQLEDAPYVVLRDRYARTHHLRIEDPTTAKPGVTSMLRGALGSPPSRATPARTR